MNYIKKLINMKVNIPKNIDDPFYRYKREIIKISKGKVKQTKIVNLEKISKDLSRNINDLIKYFSKELATNMSKNCILNGNFTVNELEEVLEKYIDEKILCKKCGNPETMICKNKILCKSCGNKYDKDKIVKNNYQEVTNFDKLKNFVLSSEKDLKNIRDIRDEHRLTPEELTYKISIFLLEDLKTLIHFKDKWNQYFLNSVINQKIILNNIFLFANDEINILTYLKYLYDTDYVDEDVILEWYNSLPSYSQKDLKNKLSITPFVTWLQNAEYE